MDGLRSKFGGFRRNFGKGIMELVGTGILLLTIQLSVSVNSSLAPIAIGVVLISLVYAGAPISGAHFNPAVSLAIALRGKMSFREMLVYWVFQFVGGFGGACLGGIIGDSFAGISVGDDYTETRAFLAEFVFTFLLCFVVLSVATHSEVSNNSYYGAAIGLVVMSGAISVGSISGGAFNPAVALGLGLAKGDGDDTTHIIYTVVANMVGGVAAAACFYMVAPDQFEADEATVGEYNLIS